MLCRVRLSDRLGLAERVCRVGYLHAVAEKPDVLIVAASATLRPRIAFGILRMKPSRLLDTYFARWIRLFCCTRFVAMLGLNYIVVAMNSQPLL